MYKMWKEHRERRKILFIRHGESEAHIGKAAAHTEEIYLTSQGEKQAQKVAQRFLTAPDLIISSPYLRAWGTAFPTLQRFVSTPHQIWPEVKEFTYLGSLAGVCSTKQQRLMLVKKYWERADPEYKDGSGESFSQFINRARGVIERLRRQEGFVVVFTHEQFIRIVQCILDGGMESTPEGMRRFRELLQHYPLSYGYDWEMPLSPWSSYSPKNYKQEICATSFISPVFASAR